MTFPFTLHMVPLLHPSLPIAVHALEGDSNIREKKTKISSSDNASKGNCIPHFQVMDCTSQNIKQILSPLVSFQQRT